MTTAPVRIHADHTTTKRLGNWTTATSFEVRERRADTVLDLRSPRIGDGKDDIEIRVDLDRAVLKLLVPDGAVVDASELRWTGRGRVKDGAAPADAGKGRAVRIVGRIDNGEIRIHRGGIAMLSAMFSREYVEDVRRAHRDGGVPTVDDPSRTA
ncbi:hypothetical protein [Streptomyces sp. SID3343]|uniref:hypothetical protein n=1 Tax=Streptomyces sp. SID3343 TaxID=2690260 RepID=UPI00136AD3CD|nr:hypothetical protein [Streptomyces sp. SID3343]MYW02241.1 hypothetical protein [Streptomyces sp. SID3343]